MAAETETLIFVDVDGVLNVGIKDGDEAPLLLNAANVAFAEHAGQGKAFARSLSEGEQRAVDKLLAVARAEDDLGAPLQDRICQGERHVSEPLLRRLGDLVAAARRMGPTKVILASNWRRPKYAARVRALEQDMSRLMGEKFAFDGRTRPGDERRAADRLRCIGDYLEHHSQSATGPMRVVVLDDLFVTPLDGWLCGNASTGIQRVRQVSDMEAYLRSRIVQSGVAVKMIHPVSEWTTPSGMLVQVGRGLNEEEVQGVLEFLAPEEPVKATVSDCSTEPAEDSPTHDDELVEMEAFDANLVLTEPAAHKTLLCNASQGDILEKMRRTKLMHFASAERPARLPAAC